MKAKRRGKIQRRGRRGRSAECAEKGNTNCEKLVRLTSWRAGAQPFDSAPPNLRMNRPAGRFTSSAPTLADAFKSCGRRDETFRWLASYQVLHGDMCAATSCGTSTRSCPNC